jgi:hypothetical protein
MINVIKISQFKMIVLASAALVLSACANSGAIYPDGWGESPANYRGATTTLPRDWRALGDSPAEKSIRDAMEFAANKRFGEARRILAQLREGVPPKSKTYRLLTASMAHLSLHQGDIAAARRLGRQLENALENKTRPDPAVVNVIAISRALDGKETPINTPADLSLLLRELDRPAAKKADISRTRN